VELAITLPVMMSLLGLTFTLGILLIRAEVLAYRVNSATRFLASAAWDANSEQSARCLILTGMWVASTCNAVNAMPGLSADQVTIERAPVTALTVSTGPLTAVTVSAPVPLSEAWMGFVLVSPVTLSSTAVWMGT
jgi:hypothetical protein